MDEKENLDFYSEIYDVSASRDMVRFTSRYTYRMIKPYIVGKRILLLGIGDGHVMAKLLDEKYFVTVLEGSPRLYTQYRDSGITERSPVELVSTLFEDYAPFLGKKYDTVIASHVLEHVEDPAAVVDLARKSICPGGRAIFTVPNAQSLHRRIGVKMGIIDSESDIGPTDLKIGHRRIYIKDEFINTIERGELSITTLAGYGLKLVPNIFRRNYEERLLDAIFELSRDLPIEMCSNLMAICKQINGGRHGD